MNRRSKWWEVGGARRAGGGRIISTARSRRFCNLEPTDNQLIQRQWPGRIYRIPAAGGEPVVNRHRPQHPQQTTITASRRTGPSSSFPTSRRPTISRASTSCRSRSDARRLVVGRSDARSYWHGWSPDGRTTRLCPCLRRQPRATTSTPRDLAGGPERPLIAGEGVDDGPEYSPDGRYIYFNSTRSGAMQIWRAHCRRRFRS